MSTPSGSETRLVRTLNSLLEVSKALSLEVDPDSLLAVIQEKAAEVMEAERSSIFIHEASTGTLRNRVSGDRPQGSLTLPVGVGIAGHAATTGRIVNIPDAYQDPRFNASFDRETGFRTRAVLCAPLLSHRGQLLGVIQVLNKRGGGAFTRDDEALLLAFAAHAGVALDRGRLIEAAIENERHEETLRLAHDIQMGMLPRTFPEGGRFELGAALRPARAVGGDFYDFLEKDGRLWFAVGDVSGKGVGAALFMAVTKTLLRARIADASSPSAVMAWLNRELSRDNERAMFVTSFLGCLDGASGELLFCNGGHNPPYLMRAGGTVEVLSGGSGLALGIIADAPYEEARASIRPGDGLFLYTDGVTEALNRRGEQYSVDGLQGCLQGLLARSAADQVQGVLADVDAFVDGASPSDDLTILAVRLRSA